MSIGSMIKKLNNQLEADKNEGLKKSGLTGTQLDILIYLDGREGEITSQKDIGEYFGIKHTTTIQLLKRLEEKQFVYREVNKKNAKFKDVYLTEKGRQKVKCVLKIRVDIDESLLDGLTAEERSEFMRFLDRVYENLKNLHK